MTEPVRLPHRAIISVNGEDHRTFLGGLITNSLRGADDNMVSYAALLTPQGKVIADFLVFPGPDGVHLDCAEAVADDLVRRLSMFKLRSRVDIRREGELCAVAFAGSPDPRSAEAARRSIVPTSDAPAETNLDAYHSARVLAAVPEQSVDFDSGEVFPADINMDAVDGIDFAKGCFVGQEVVSRMKRRGTARRRTILLSFDETAETGEVMAGDVEIGVVTSVSGTQGLARVRIDRVAEAEAEQTPLLVGGRVVKAVWPSWLTPDQEG